MGETIYFTACVAAVPEMLHDVAKDTVWCYSSVIRVIRAFCLQYILTPTSSLSHC